MNINVSCTIFVFELWLKFRGKTPRKPALLNSCLGIDLHLDVNDFGSMVVQEHSHSHTQKQRFASLMRTSLQATILSDLSNTCTVQNE